MIGYLDEDIRGLVLIIPKTSGYVKTLKVEDKNNELMFSYIVYDKILPKYKAIWTKIEDLKILN